MRMRRMGRMLEQLQLQRPTAKALPNQAINQHTNEVTLGGAPREARRGGPQQVPLQL
jgi:hypothetical protein